MNYKYDLLEGSGIDKENEEVYPSSPRFRPLVKIPFRHLIRLVVSLPLIPFLVNIAYVLYVNFDEATNTLCYDHRVINNYLPSFSAVIGLFEFPRAFWNTAVALHAAPRFLFVTMTYSYLDYIILPKYKKWNRVVVFLGFVENFGLILLTYVSSKANFPVHMWSFVSFILASEFYMLIYCLLLHKCRAILPTSTETKSLRIKWRLMIMNICSAILSGFIYVRHVTYCEPGVYTLFAICEYVVVLTNMGYHGSAYWDFYDRNLVI